MRLVFDVDDTICEGGHPYSECVPLPGVIDNLRQLKACGHEIVLATARYMLMEENNQAKATERGRLELVDWCIKYGVPFDEVYFGKPVGHLYIDDKGFRLDPNNREECWKELFKMVEGQ